MFADLATVPSHDEDPSFYSDWGDPREFTLGDMGVGECAGEVVSLTEFDFAAAEARIFEAQSRLEEQAAPQADELAYGAMLLGARGLIKTDFIDIGDDPDAIVREFRARFFDTRLFFDKYAGGKFAMYLFRRHESGPPRDARSGAPPDSRKRSSFSKRATRARRGSRRVRPPACRPHPRGGHSRWDTTPPRCSASA